LSKMRVVILSVFLLFCLAAGSPSCGSFKDCTSCASHSTWVPGQHCRWCPKQSACHAELSTYDSCSSKEIVTAKDKCPASPAPAPAPPAPKSPLAANLLAELFKLLGITDVDATTCVNDFGGADIMLRDFAQDMNGKNYTLAVSDLSRALSALSSSVSDCGLLEFQAKIDTLAASIRWANISTAGFDKGVEIIVDGSDLWNDVSTLATAVKKKDSTAIGSALGKLLSDWTSISGGCGANSTTCKFLDGLLKMVQVVAQNVAPCEAAIQPAIVNLTQGIALFENKQYAQAVGAVASGLDDLAEALATDACGLEKVAAVLSEVAPKLASAIVRAENSTRVKILVGTADVYDELYKAAIDVKNGDIEEFGTEIGLLLSKLRAASCNTPACTVLEGVLAALQLEAQDWAKCAPEIDQAWSALPAAIADLQGKNYTKALTDLSLAVTAIASSVKDCGTPELAVILEKLATKLGAPGIATEIGSVVQVLVEGADVTLDLSKLVQDGNAGAWSAVGHDLGTLATWLQDTGCKSFVCKLVEGLLNAAAIPFQNLEACETDLKEAESDFRAGASAMGQNQLAAALKFWASGLNHVAKSTSDCGLAAELSYMEQEANLLGFGNVTILGDTAQLIIHGADFYEALYGAFVAFETHDYRTAGADMGQVMNQLSQWTTKHACTAPVCYVVSGMMQFLGDIQGDIKSCEADLQHSWGNFSAAYSELKSTDADMTDQQKYMTNADFSFAVEAGSVKVGIRDLGMAVKSVSSSVGDCHLAELSEILEKLAVRLGIVPEVQWVEDALKILIDGVPIENEIGNACIDWSTDNWVGFGYNVIQLIKNLL